MRIELANEKNLVLCKKWREVDRLEESTCRPVMNNQRIKPSDEIVTLFCFIDVVTEPIGRFSYFDMNPRNKSAEFGYRIHPDFRHQGLGKQMVWACLDYLFKMKDFNKFYCQTGAFNVASVKLLERLELHCDAVLREHHELDGKFYDDYIYSILRREWLAKTCHSPSLSGSENG